MLLQRAGWIFLKLELTQKTETKDMCPHPKSLTMAHGEVSPTLTQHPKGTHFCHVGFDAANEEGVGGVERSHQGVERVLKTPSRVVMTAGRGSRPRLQGKAPESPSSK